MSAWIGHWLLRHQHPASRILHLIGIPLLMMAAVVAGWQIRQGVWSLWWRPVALTTISYLLQGIGHAIEGNDMGEVILIKKLLGRSYIAVAPRYRSSGDGVTQQAQE